MKYACVMCSVSFALIYAKLKYCVVLTNKLSRQDFKNDSVPRKKTNFNDVSSFQLKRCFTLHEKIGVKSAVLLANSPKLSAFVTP